MHMTEAEIAAAEAGKSKSPRRRRPLALECKMPSEIKIPRVTRDQLKARFDEFDGECAYCRRSLGGWLECRFELDHVLADAKGGLSIIQNLVYACSHCNISKSSHDVIPWLRSRSDYKPETEIRLISVFPHLLLLFPKCYE